MAFRKKLATILSNNPDILIVPESEQPTKVDFERENFECFSSVWIGDNPSKGLGIYSFNKYTVRLHDSYTDKFKYIAPIEVTYNDSRFIIIAVWAMPCKIDRNQRYIGQVYRALEFYSNLINKDTILVGDFNWNLSFDKDKKTENFKDVVNFLSKKNMVSLYHHNSGEDFGYESKDTFFMQKKANKGYHIDYCCVGKRWLENKIKFGVENFLEWSKMSDHVPIIFESCG
ncbi:MAG: endonuclease/exonuclease/phosphatase family protein [Maridesulfovibrio ferrireducens]|nr:hypothetical protein [Maridesulfovibrio ferrireducens]MBI9112279.1 endonuclease/exonuclease/phosphatase family protein [Maridesulfovibrio ferrireducens]